MNKKYNTNKYHYYDLDKYLLKDGELIDKYKDISKLNIHLRWEPMIPLHIKELNKICGLLKSDLIKDLSEEEEKYLEYKKKDLERKFAELDKLNK